MNVANAHTIESLIKKLESTIIDVVNNEVSDELVDIVKRHVEDDVYSKYTPAEYKRTGDLKNSVQKEVELCGDNIEININHDDDQLNYESLLGQELDPQKVPWLIEEGKIHPLFGGGFSYLQARPYMSNAHGEIKGLIEKILGKAIVNRLK